MSRLIYLDNAATTKTAPEVVDAMIPYFTEHYGNPSSVYSFASGNKEVVSRQREIIAQALGAQANEIYFTAGGSESDNWALKATAEAYEKKGKHIITTKIEHHAILHTCEYLEKQRGFEITYLDVDENGVVKLDELKKAIRPDTILISVMFANNEIGTIQPIREIGEIAQEHKILFHTDAVRHLARYRLMWMPVILICSAQADISSTDRKESDFYISAKESRSDPLYTEVHRRESAVPEQKTCLVLLEWGQLWSVRCGQWKQEPQKSENSEIT